MGEVLRIVKERGDDIDTMPVRPRGLAGLITLVTDGVISTSAGKTVLEAMLAMGSRVDTADTAAQIVAERGLAQALTLLLEQNQTDWDENTVRELTGSQAAPQVIPALTPQTANLSLYDQFLQIVSSHVSA